MHARYSRKKRDEQYIYKVLNMKRVKSTFIPKHFRPKVKGEKMKPSHTNRQNQIHELTQEKNIEVIQAIVLLYVREDCSQTRIIEQQTCKYEVISLVYDDLGITWNFSFYKNELCFYKNNKKILPLGIYNRSYFPRNSHPRFHLYNNLMRVFEVWQGPMIGAKMSHFHNSSKAYQMTTTIREAIKKTKAENIAFPKSFFIKGISQLKQLTNQMEHLIVKSSSGIRSEVATKEIFMKWDLSNISHLPVLFQAACYGPDIRIHRLDEECWSVILSKKEGSIDYRYAKKRGHFEKLKPAKQVEEFCKTLAKIENVRLIGVDFIQTQDTMFCLESNPSPGWAGFHRNCGDETQIAQTLLSKVGGVVCIS